MQIDESKIILKPTQVYYLRMDENPHFNITDIAGTEIKEIIKPVSANTYRRWYATAGADYYWLDRLVMPADELNSIINQSNNFLFVLYYNNEEAGYAEIVKEGDYTELAYFGLFPQSIGKGLGKYFLQWSITKAWSFNPKWIQVNTCALDHPNALPLYKKMGFVEYKTTTEQRKILA